MEIRALGMSAAEFLSQYWGKAPLLVRGAFESDALASVSPDELAGLAVEQDVVSRLVFNEPPDSPSQWRVEFGPFEGSEFARLPESNWTLLVQEVDRHVAGVSDLMTPFRFLPNWRFDDVMVSFAVAGGGVGAHIDRYDVFLVQGSGKRLWQIGESPVHTPDLVEHDELQLLREFEPAFSWEVGPGDLIYLPPGFAHSGVALTESLAYSVGFRMPSVRDILVEYAEDYAAAIDRERLLRLSVDGPTEAPGLIDAGTLDAVRSIIRAIAYDEAAIDDWYCRHISVGSRRMPEFDAAEEGPIGAEDVVAHLQAGARLVRTRPTSFVYLPVADDRAALYVEGVRYDLESLIFARLLTGTEALSAERLEPFLNSAANVRVLAELVANAHLELQR